MPLAVDKTIRQYLPTGGDFDGLMNAVDAQFKSDCEDIMKDRNNLWVAPSHFMDILRDDKKYNNFGIHGCGIACAADSLAAAERLAAVDTLADADALATAERLASTDALVDAY